MQREKLESLIIDYIDGKLNAIEKQNLEQELIRNKDYFKLYEQFKEVMHAMDNASSLIPSTRLRTAFDRIIQEEVQAAPKAKTVLFSPNWYKVAAVILLVLLAGGTGYWFNAYQQQQSEIAKIKAEMQRTKELMMAMLHNENSASQRLLGVKAAYESTGPDDEIVAVLIKTMNEDPSSNVRLAAIDALKKFQQETKVRNALIEALTTQKDPVVQITLIQLMVEMKEKQAVKSLQNIIEDKEALPAVKDEAHAGLFRLS